MELTMKLMGSIVALVMGVMLMRGMMTAPSEMRQPLGVESSAAATPAQVSCTFYHCTPQDNCTQICGDFAFCDRGGFCTLQ
ncbi:MAG TPA: hypothetical protein VGH20_05055 [Myxococcales bacterium]|jgi:hypothetical protein